MPYFLTVADGPLAMHDDSLHLLIVGTHTLLLEGMEGSARRVSHPHLQASTGL
jgi:hypothetical protein